MMINEKLIQSFRLNRKAWLSIISASILFLALFLRLWNLGGESAWIDEAYSIELAKHSVLDILKGTAADQHPPLYYLLLHFWLLFGSGISYARLLSVIIGVINVGQILHFGYKATGITVGFLGSFLIAVSPMHVWYSQEIRMYILLLGLTTASTTTLWWALQRKQGYLWILYCFFTVLAIYTHYFAAFIILAQGIWVLIWAWKQQQMRSLLYWIGSMAVLGLLFMPWLPVAINQTRFHTMTWVDSPTIAIIRDTLLRLIFGIAILSLPGILLWVVTVIILAFFIWSIKSFLPLLKVREGLFFYISSWSLIPFAAISMFAFIYPVYQFKQYLIIVPPILILAAWVSFRLPRKIGIAAFLIILISASVSLTYQQLTLTKDDWKGAASYIEQNFKTGDIIFGNPAASSLALSLYADIPLPIQGIPADYNIINGGWEGEISTPQSADLAFRNLGQKYQRVWLVEFFPEFWDIDRTIEAWLGQNAQLQSDQYFSRIHVRMYRFANQ
jgi:mannosyltransferase